MQPPFYVGAGLLYQPTDSGLKT